MARDKDTAKKEYDEKFKQLVTKFSQGQQKSETFNHLIDTLAEKGDFASLEELQKVIRQTLKLTILDATTQENLARALIKIRESMPEGREFFSLAEDINDLFSAIPRNVLATRQQEQLIKRLVLLADMRSRVFELVTVRPGRIAGADEALTQVQDTYAQAVNLLGKEAADLRDPYDIAQLVYSLGDIDPSLVESFLKTTENLEKYAGSSLKASKISAQAHIDFLKNRTILKRINRSFPQHFTGFMAHLKGFSDTGDSLAHHTEKAIGTVIQLMFSLSVQAEQAKMQGSSLEPGNTLKKEGLLQKSANHTLRLAGFVQQNFDKFEKALKLLSESLLSVISVFSLVFKVLTYSSQATKSVVELLGTQNLTYGLAIDDTQLSNTVMSVNAALNDVDVKFAQTYESRVKGIEAYIKAGGSVKVLGLKSGVLTSPFRNFFEPLDTAARFAPLLGKSQEDIMNTLGDLNSSTILTMGQIEDIFEQVIQGSIDTSTPTSQTLDVILEMTRTFGGVLSTFYVNQAILTQIARRTQFNERQAFRAISGILDSIKGLSYLDIPSLLTLAGFDLDHPEAIRTELKSSLRALRESLVASLATAKNPVDVQRIHSQLDMLAFYENTTEKGDLFTAVMNLAQQYPQALLGIYQRAIDGQIDLIYQGQAKRVKSNMLEYTTALRTVGQRLNIPKEYYEMLVASRFTERGSVREGSLSLDRLASVTPTPTAAKDKTIEAAMEWYKQVNSGAAQLNQIKDSFFTTIFEKATIFVNRITDFILNNTIVRGIVAGVGLAGIAGLAIAASPLGLGALLAGVGIAGVGGYLLGSRSTDSYRTMSERTVRSLASKAHLAGPIVEAALAEGVPPAVLAALKVQETRDADFIGDTDAHIGHFQFDINLWRMSREEAYDIRASARQTARNIKAAYLDIARRAARRNIKLTDAQIWGLAASSHALSAVPYVLSGSFRYGKGKYFQSNLPEGASFEQVRAEANRFMQEAAPWNAQEGGGGSYYEDVMIHMDNASHIPVFSGQGLTPQMAANRMVNTPDQPETGRVSPPRVPSHSTARLPTPAFPSAPSLPSPPSSNPVSLPSVQISASSSLAQPQLAPEALPITVTGLRGNLRYEIRSDSIEDVTKQVQETFQDNNGLRNLQSLNFIKNNYYRTVYARTASDIYKVWNAIVGSSGL